MFTIIITTHDRPLLLRRALQSLIAQTFQNFTVIIVSDSATYIPPYEELAALNGRYSYVIRSGVAGPAESRNIGIKLAESAYIMFLDDDDTLEPNHLENMASYIKNSSPDILFCSFKVYEEDRSFNPPKIVSAQAFSIENITRESIFVRNTIPNCCLMYRSDVIKNRTHNLSMRIYEDWDFLLSCLIDFSFVYVPVFSVVIHKTIVSGDAENLRRGNTREDLVCVTTLDLYKKYPAPSDEIRLARQSFFSNAGINLDIEYF